MFFPSDTPIVVINRALTGVDDYGKQKWSETESGPYDGGFDPALGFESNDGRGQVTSQPQAYLPPEAPIKSTSVLVIDGKRYEVDGRAGDWHLDGWHPGWQVPLKEATG